MAERLPHNSTSAYLAALQLLNGEGSDRDSMPDILMSINPNDAIPALFAQALREPDERVKFRILSALASTSCIEKDLSFWLKSNDSEHRKIACEICIVGPDRAPLESLRSCLQDSSEKVEREARIALQAYSRYGSIKRLLDEYSVESDRRRKWILLDAVLSLAVEKNSAINPRLFSIIRSEKEPLVKEYVENAKLDESAMNNWLEQRRS